MVRAWSLARHQTILSLWVSASRKFCFFWFWLHHVACGIPSSLTRDWTCAPCGECAGVLTPGPPGKFRKFSWVTNNVCNFDCTPHHWSREVLGSEGTVLSETSETTLRAVCQLSAVARLLLSFSALCLKRPSGSQCGLFSDGSTRGRGKAATRPRGPCPLILICQVKSLSKVVRLFSIITWHQASNCFFCFFFFFGEGGN